MSQPSTRRCMSPWQAWIKICYYYNHAIESLFEKLAYRIATHPFQVIGFCFVVMVGLASGFLFMEVENTTEKLYIPQESESIDNLKKAKVLGFHRPHRLTEVILLNNTGDNDVLTKQCFEDAFFIHNITTSTKGYKNVCLSKTGENPVDSITDCITDEPLRILNYSSNSVENILKALNFEESTRNVKLDRVLGGIKRNLFGEINSAKAIRLTYYIKGTFMSDNVSEETLEWEKEFLERMRSINGDLKCGQLSYTTGRSVEDATLETIGSDTKLIALTFTIMISFACIMLGKFRNPLTGHGLLAMSGTLAVGLGIMTAFGLAMYCGIPFVSIVGILPFLIVGVGIDDMFIIVDELDRTSPDQAVPKRLAKLMKDVGPAITMTTITDLLAFAVGTTSAFPSISHFCKYAALAIMFAYLYLVTIFVAFIGFDCKRMNAGRRDMLPCLKAPVPAEGKPRWDESLPQMSNKVMQIWGKILMKPYAKVIVVLMSFALLAVGLYGATFIDEQFDRRQMAKDGSEFVQFLDTSEANFDEDIPVDVIIESGVNYSDPTTQRNMAILSTIITNNKYYRPNITSWYNQFQKWSLQYNSTVNFMVSLQDFLKRYPRFRADIVLTSDNRSIEASRLYCNIKETISSVALRNAMTTLRDDLKEKSSLPVFPNSYNFIFFEQYVLTFSETVRNLVLSAVAILVVTTLFLVNPLVVFLVLVAFASLIFELLGLMYIWGVALNSISMINLVMAIGFAVDYSAHVAHFFVFSTKTSPEEKVIDSLGTVGASVFMGGFTTFLGMAATAFASAEIFRIFFKMFFGIVVLGLLHGLCFLPVWMSIICRWNVVVDFKKDSARQSASWGNNMTSPTPNHEGSRTNPVIDMNAAVENPNSQTTSF